MKSKIVSALASFALFAAASTANALTKADFQNEIIRESATQFAEQCPCPYYLDRAGKPCGNRSTWSRRIRANNPNQPLCYKNEVTDEILARYEPVQLFVISASHSEYRMAALRRGNTGNCACPYDVDAARNACGERSAWSRSGGTQPICYEHEVTSEVVRVRLSRAQP